LLAERVAREKESEQKKVKMFVADERLLRMASKLADRRF
jgi:hypothetical protein